MDNAETEKVTLPKSKSSKKNKVFIIIGAIVVFIVGLILIANMATSAPAKISEELIADIQALDSSSAYSLMSDEAKNVTSSTDFAAAISQIGPILTGKPSFVSKEVSAETGSKNTATVIYNIDGSDGIKYTITIKLAENDGKWQVDTFYSEKQGSEVIN